MDEADIHILMVEDDEEDGILNRSYLSEGPFRHSHLHWARTVDEGLKVLNGQRVDVLMSDLNLPDSRGIQTVKTLLAAAPDCAFLLFTGAEDESIGLQAVQAGVQEYLVKGQADGRVLSRAIRYALERKSIERVLQQYRADLEQRVERRTEELRQVNRELRVEIADRKRIDSELRATMARVEEQNRARMQFVSNVSHDLRTPLTSMLYAVDNLLDGVVGPVENGVRSYLQMLRSDCQRLVRTVNDILDLSRLEARTLVLYRVKTPLHRLVLQAIGSLQMYAAENRVMLSAAGGLARGMVDCDRDKMSRVLFNIFQNGVKFTPRGGFVEIELVPAEDPPPGILVHVKDSGIGIPAEYIGRVTDRYFRIGEEVSGSGLGLSIAREIVELHGGCLRIVSPVPGRECGTQVSVRLPLASGTVVVLCMGSAAARERGAVELAADGFEVRGTANGPEALMRLQADVPDALVLDFDLEGMDAVELIARLKSNLEWKKVPVVAVGRTPDDGAVRSILDGFHIPLVRPDWPANELAAAVERAMMDEA